MNVIKKNIKRSLVLVILCSMLLTIFAAQVSASYLGGCSKCGGDVVAFCDGEISRTQREHKFDKILWIFGGKTCKYTAIAHATTDYCQVNTTHVTTGDDVYAYKGHIYDDVGNNICGMKDTPDSSMCSKNQVAYRSGQ